MKRIIMLITLLLLFFITSRPYALEIGDIVAYPVPFNPKKGPVKYLTIGNAPNKAPIDTDRLKIEIFDVNGDLVWARHFTSSTAMWNGRNDSGSLVKPGMYIIKVTAEKSSTGDFGRKIIRILINY